MNYVKLYQIFKHENGSIWKIDYSYFPEDEVGHWVSSGMFLREKDLVKMGVNLK